MLFRKKNKTHVSDFETQREETLLKNIPLVNNEWNIPFLYEYLVEVNYDRGRENIALTFFDQHLSDVKLAKILLEEFLLNDEYDGSESQLGAAVILRYMDRSALLPNKDLLLEAQKNEVFWKRPFPEGEDLSWLA